MLFARPFLLLMLAGSTLAPRADEVLPRSRSPRLLRVLDAEGAALQGDCLAPQFNGRGDGLFFLRSDNAAGGRALWFAAPAPAPGERYPAWRAAPVWQSDAPLQLSEAVSLRGDAAFVGIGAASGAAPASTLWRFQTGKKNRTRALWSGRERLAHLAPSPDGNFVVFTRYALDAGGRETPQLWRIGANGRGETPVLVAPSARRAFWLDGHTVVFERLDKTGTAFYALNPFASAPPRLLLLGSGEGASLSGGAGLVFAARGVNSPASSLFVLARDGSGLRSLGGTSGARHPACSLDGTGLAFDAPDPKTGARALWLAALDAPLKTTPVALSRAGWPHADRTALKVSPNRPASEAVGEAPAPLQPGRSGAGACGQSRACGSGLSKLDLKTPPKSRPRAFRCELAPMPLPPPAPPKSAPRPTTPAPTPTPVSTPTPSPRSTPPSQAQPQLAPTAGAPAQDGDKADLDVAGTPAKVRAGGKMRVVVWAKNRGTRDWTPKTVRVVVRWLDFDAGTRRRWEWKWMPTTLAPLEQMRLPLGLTAPPKAGRYKVIYGLIRVSSKGAGFSPPPFDAPQESWPGEFAATAFAVEVR